MIGMVLGLFGTPCSFNALVLLYRVSQATPTLKIMYCLNLNLKLNAKMHRSLTGCIYNMLTYLELLLITERRIFAQTKPNSFK